MKNSQLKIKAIRDYILSYSQEYGYPPSVREICAEMKFKSPSTAQYYLDKMKQDGIVEVNSSKKRSLSLKEKVSFLTVPLVGTITAGEPIFAVENLEGYYPIPSEFATDSDLFLLKVKGTSMKNAGILNGDKIIVKKQDYAKNGDIVVAYFDESATVKRYFTRENKVILHPENEEYSDIILDNVNILGVVKGLFRKM